MNAQILNCNAKRYIQNPLSPKFPMKKYVFLDRDGVLNKKRDDYVKSTLELEILPKIHLDLKRLIEHNFELIIITNQSLINRGKITIEQEETINQKLLDFLQKNHIPIKKIYICPHRPDENCNCRKPKTGLIDKAVNDFDIDLSSTWFIGDSDTDRQAAQNSGCNFLLNETNGDISELVDFILKNSK